MASLCLRNSAAGKQNEIESVGLNYSDQRNADCNILALEPVSFSNCTREGSLNRFAVAGWIVPLWLCVFFFSPGAMTGQTLIQSSPGTRLEEGMLSSLRQVAQSLERNGQIDQALDLLLQYSQDLRVLAYIGQICDKNGMQAQFLPLAAGAYQREPGNPEALVLYIKALHSQNLQDSLLAVS